MQLHEGDLVSESKNFYFEIEMEYHFLNWCFGVGVDFIIFKVSFFYRVAWRREENE